MQPNTVAYPAFQVICHERMSSFQTAEEQAAQVIQAIRDAEVAHLLGGASSCRDAPHLETRNGPSGRVLVPCSGHVLVDVVVLQGLKSNGLLVHADCRVAFWLEGCQFFQPPSSANMASGINDIIN